MTREQFDALLVRRDELERDHTLQCAILAEMVEGRLDVRAQRRECNRLYDERVELQLRIDAEIAAERALEGV